MIRNLLAVAVLMVGCGVHAEANPQDQYEVSTEGTSVKVKAGEKGKLVIEIRPKAGAHVSDEAPLKIELSSKESKLDASKLGYKDSVGKKKQGEDYATPRFEIGFTPSAQGKTTLEAKMTFFICTASQCARQTKNLSVPVDVM